MPQYPTSFLGQEICFANRLTPPHLSLRFPKSLSKTFNKIPWLCHGIFKLKDKFIKLKYLRVSPQTLTNFWKSWIKTFIKMQFHCIFRKKIISCILRFGFFKFCRIKSILHCLKPSLLMTTLNRQFYISPLIISLYEYIL